MEKKQKAIQVYAIIICIISVITIIISLSSLVSAMIDRSDPIYANRYDISLTSFENFKMNSLKSIGKDQAYIPNDQELLKMFEDARADKIKMIQHQSNRTIVVSSLIIIISILLFASHWWIMKKTGRIKEEIIE
jgi:ATP-dependent Zn protease